MPETSTHRQEPSPTTEPTLQSPTEQLAAISSLRTSLAEAIAAKDHSRAFTLRQELKQRIADLQEQVNPFEKRLRLR